MTKAPRLIHLRVPAEYSLREGAILAEKLAGLREAAEMPAVAVTDSNVQFAAPEVAD